MANMAIIGIITDIGMRSAVAGAEVALVGHLRHRRLAVVVAKAFEAESDFFLAVAEVFDNSLAR